MGTYSFNYKCSCCNIVLFSVTGADAQAWKDDANFQGGHKAMCPACGCKYVTEDDGVATNLGGGVQAKDISAPRIDSLGEAASGSIAGGTVIRINGHGFNAATPIVKFDYVDGTNIVVLSDIALDVTTPPGKLTLFLAAGPYDKLEHGSVTGGPFVVGETITGSTSSETAVIKEVGSGFLLVDNQSGAFAASEILIGGTSGATASYTSVSNLPFQVGEVVTGATSGSTGTINALHPFKISSPSASFSDNEEIVGGTSGARALLATPSQSGVVDVSVENVHGQRAVGGIYPGLYVYTV